MPKVTFIGASSIEFARDDVIDLCAMPDIGDIELVLHDPDVGRLALVDGLVRRIVDAAPVTAKVHSCSDRVEALDGADYVISELEVGGIEATRVDLDIPARYGLRQTVADTIGVGGIFRGLRTIPVAVDIAADMTRVCPNSYLLTYTNPMAMATQAVSDATSLNRVFGLCHSVEDTRRFLVELIGAPPDEVEFLAAGVNHQSFVLRLSHRGTSLYQRLSEVIARTAHVQGRLSVELFHRLGFFPVELADQPAEYLSWVMRHDTEVARLGVTVGTATDRAAEQATELTQLASEARGGLSPALSGGRALGAHFVHAVETGTSAYTYATVPNHGLISNLPPGAPVEVPCRVEQGRVEPVPIGALPPQLAALNRIFLSVVELTVAAVLERDRHHAYHAALFDPNTAATLTAREIVGLCDDLFEAHRERLPRALVSGSGRPTGQWTSGPGGVGR